MKKWYKQSYFNRRNWILENYDKLNICNDEVLFLLLIDFAKENRKPITYEYLRSKLSCDDKKIDKMIASLHEKHFLTISSTTRGVSFDIEGIFEFDPGEYESIENVDIFSAFESLKKRPLSPIEMQKLSDLVEKYGDNRVNDAIREAEAYSKTSLSYIEAILANEKK